LNTTKEPLTKSCPLNSEHQHRPLLPFLLLTNTFPPRGGSSVQRAAKFAKYAHRNGESPIVITASFSGGLTDPSLVNDLPSELEVHRVTESTLSSASILTRLLRRTGLLRLPDEHAAYGRAATRKACEIAKYKTIGAVFISYGVPSTLIAGIRIAGRLKCPVILDIRDFKRKNAYSSHKIRPSRPLRDFMIKCIEAWAFAKVDYFTVVSQNYKEILSDHYAIPEDRVAVIYNGYDPEDFNHALNSTNTQHLNPVLRYVGFVTHQPSLENLLVALRAVNELRHRQSKPMVRLEIIGGNNHEALEQIIARHNATEWCTARRYVPHAEAVDLMKSADGLVLLQHAEHGCLTGKFFEYVGAARPILLLDNENHELRSLVKQNDLGVVAPHDDIEHIVASIDTILNMTVCQAGKKLDNFRRDIQTDQFLGVIQKAMKERAA